MDTLESEMVEDGDVVGEDEVTQLPDKCQSLRQRSIRKRIETERNKHLPKQRKQRERPAPLSKYREEENDDRFRVEKQLRISKYSAVSFRYTIHQRPFIKYPFVPE